jgi:hypothetical protein
VSELKELLKLLEPPARTVKDVVADGFTERQWKREQKRQARKERKAASAVKRNSAIASAKAEASAKLPKTKAAGGNS